MRLVIALVLVALVRSAAADPTAKRDCKAAGGVFFEVAQRADGTAKRTTAMTRLFANGAWKTEVFDAGGKLARSHAGCLAPSVLEAIRTELRSATWKTTRTTATCRADQPRFTLYKWKGRLLYTERACNVDVLDDISRHALDLIDLHLHTPLDLDGAGTPCIDDPLAKGCD